MKIQFLAITLLLAFGAKAQHSLVMTRPLEFNGGLAGNTGHDRLSFNTYSTGYIGESEYSGFQSRIIGKNLNFHSSYDWLSEKVKGGIGIYINSRSNQFTTVYEEELIKEIRTFDNGFFVDKEIYYVKKEKGKNTIEVGTVYSPKFILNGKIGFSPFVDLAISNKKISTIETRLDNNESLNSTYSPQGHYTNLITKFGILLNKERWFFGYKLIGINASFGSGNEASNEYNAKTINSKMINVKTGEVNLYSNVSENWHHNLEHKFQAGYFIRFSKDSRYGFGLILENTIRYYKMEYTINSTTPSYKLKLLTISELNLYLKLSKIIIGVGQGGVSASYKHSDKWSIGYSFRPIDKIKYSQQEIGFQYVFKRKEGEKLFSVPIKG